MEGVLGCSGLYFHKTSKEQPPVGVPANGGGNCLRTRVEIPLDLETQDEKGEKSINWSKLLKYKCCKFDKQAAANAMGGLLLYDFGNIFTSGASHDPHNHENHFW